MENIELHLVPNGPEVILREGKAPNLFDPIKVELNGTITASADYLDNRTETDVKSAYVVANYKHRTITLQINERDKFGAVITGKLDLYPDLEALHINRDRMYTQMELYNLLKFKGAWFQSRDAHDLLLQQLKSFEAKVSQEFQNANDYKGSAAHKKLTEIKTNIGLNFVLYMPIFTGGKSETISVEILVEAESGAPRFWFESVELHEAIITGTEEIFQKELERFGSKGVVIISQYS
jgi:hypothetical protein